MNSKQVQHAYEILLKKYEKVLLKLQETQSKEHREVVVPMSSKAERMYVDKIRQLESLLKQKESTPSSYLHEAARLLVNSEFNKEHLSEQDIFELLTKLSEDEVNKALGFWAIPLPSEDSDNSTKPRYTSKK